MDLDFKRGYSVYTRKLHNLVITTPHSGPSMFSPVARDDYSDTMASYLWGDIGGKLIIANITRNRLLGVDLNRDIPPLKSAIEHYSIFESEVDQEKIHEYMKRFAFVASSEDDYERRLRIYQNYWSEVESGDTIMLIHRAFNRLKTLPSIMDIIILGNERLRDKFSGIITKLNNKYYNFLKTVEKDYKQATLIETRRFILDILMNSEFDMDKMGLIKRKAIEKDLIKMKRYASPVLVEDLRRNFTAENFINATENALSRVGMPQITLETVHDGSFAHGPKRKLFYLNKVVIEVEATQFLSFWHPQVGAKILRDLISDVKNI